MIIESLHNSYSVIQRLAPRDPAVSEFIARRDDGAEMRLVRVLGPNTAEIYQELDRVRKEGHFADLAEYFFSNGTLSLALFQPQGRSLSQLLAGGHITVAHRLLLLQNVLERLTLLSPPPYFAATALTMDNVHLSATAQAGFSYDCSDILAMDEYTFGDVARAFVQLLEDAFAPELAQGKFSELSEFCNRLFGQTWDGYMELYRAYHELYIAFRNVGDAAFLPDNAQTRIQRAVARALSYTRPVIGAVILIAVSAYLGWSIWHALQPDGHAPYFTQIGSLVLDEEDGGVPAEDGASDDEASAGEGATAEAGAEGEQAASENPGASGQTDGEEAVA